MILHDAQHDDGQVERLPLRLKEHSKQKRQNTRVCHMSASRCHA